MNASGRIHDIYSYFYSFLILFATMTFYRAFPFLRVTIVLSMNSRCSTVIHPEDFIPRDCVEILPFNYVFSIGPNFLWSSLTAIPAFNFNWIVHFIFSHTVYAIY